MQTAKRIRDEKHVTSKGIHKFTICDARSEEAQRISKTCDQIAIQRLHHMLVRGAQAKPLEQELLLLNVEIAQAKPRSSELRRLTFHQEQVLEKLAEIGKWSKAELHKLWIAYRENVEKLENKFKKYELTIENVTTTVGRAVLAQRLGGDTTYTGTVNYTALGSDNTAAAVGDATLGTEVYRKALSSGTDLSNVAYLETFFTATETTGTYEEYGMFIDGTGSADTGQLFNRFVTSITKSATETLNVQSIITFNDA